MNSMYKWKGIDRLNLNIRIQHINPHGFYFVVLCENETGKEISFKFAYEPDAVEFYKSVCKCEKIF